MQRYCLAGAFIPPLRLYYSCRFRDIVSTESPCLPEPPSRQARTFLFFPSPLHRPESASARGRRPEAWKRRSAVLAEAPGCPVPQARRLGRPTSGSASRKASGKPVSSARGRAAVPPRRPDPWPRCSGERHRSFRLRSPAGATIHTGAVAGQTRARSSRGALRLGVAS